MPLGQPRALPGYSRLSDRRAFRSAAALPADVVQQDDRSQGRSHQMRDTYGSRDAASKWFRAGILDLVCRR
jgi:hypothetical protein